MPEKSILRKPEPAGKVSLLNEGLSPAFDRFLQGLFGDQLPGDRASALGAALPLLPLGKLLKVLKLGRGVNAIQPAANVGDQLLREHVLASPRMREFVPVGEEVTEAVMGKGPDALEEAYKKLLDQGGRVKPSPAGSAGLKHDQPANVQWPKAEDLEALKAKLRKKDGI